MKYIYLDREKAKKGISLVYAASEQPVGNYQEYFEGKAIEFIGEDLPHYITYVQEENTEYICEATRVELYNRGIIQLQSNETVLGGDIVEKTRAQLVADGLITIESEKDKVRLERKRHLEAVDLYDKSVLRGDLEETPEQKDCRDVFRRTWLDLPSQYTDVNISIESLYPQAPNFINYFL